MATASISTTPECSICCESFKIPKVLKCGHTFCLDCIIRYIGDKTDKFTCPICAQDVKIPEGGARMFTTNFIAQTTQQVDKITPTLPSTTNIAGTSTPLETNVALQPVLPAQHHCPYHEKPVDYYCVSCHSLICHKCFVKHHQGHEYLDVECETSKEKAKEFVSSSEKLIQNKIKELEETHTKLVEASRKLQSYTEDACRRITKQTEKIIADIQTSSQTTMIEIRNTFEESEDKLNGARENILEQMKNVKLDLESNLPSSTEDSCVQILSTLPKIKELEKLCDGMKDDTPVFYKYMAWKEHDFNVKIDMLGLTVNKQYYLNKPNCFTFDMDKIATDKKYYSKDKWFSNGIIWSCSAWKSTTNQSSFASHLCISIELLNADNPGLEYCIIDGQLSLLNINDSKTLTTSCSNHKLARGCSNWAWKKAIDWYKFAGKDSGFITLNNQFVVQLNIKQIREISSK